MVKSAIKTCITFSLLFFNSVISCIRVVLFSRFYLEINKIKITDGRKCYILGNGPTLKENMQNNLLFLKTQELFVVNDFAKSEYYSILKPNFYVLLDPGNYSNDSPKEILDYGISVLNAIRDNTHWPIFLIVPEQAAKSLTFKNIFSNNCNVKILTINRTLVTGLKNLSFFLYRYFLGIPPMQNVLNLCVLVAINMKYSEVNIIGADHSWTKDLIVNDSNIVCMSNYHFTDNDKLEPTPIPMVNGEYFKMHEILRAFAQMFEGYQILRKYAEYNNVKIFNRTPNSFIDAFEKKNIQA